MRGRRWRLSLRLLARDWRAGELRLLLAAVVLAVAASTTVGFFSDRVNRAMVVQSAELLGGDLMLVSPQPVDAAWARAAADVGLRLAETLEFASVVVQGDKLQLCNIKAVAHGYPARGRVRTATTAFGVDAPADDVPAPGSAWVEARLLSALELGVGDSIEIGAAKFTVTRVLTFDPGRGGSFIGLAPRVLIHRADVARTNVLQPGSRVSYRYLFAGSQTELARYQDWLRPRLGPHHELRDVRTGTSAVGRAIERAERYLGLASLVAVVLAGVAVAMGARRYSERHCDVSALLRCFGASRRDVVALYLPQLLLVGALAAAVGCAVGWAAQQVLLLLLRDVLAAQLPPPGLTPIAFGFLTGMVTLIGFAFPPVLRLQRVSPLRVLRRDLAPLPVSAWMVYGSALAASVALMWRYTGSWRLTMLTVAGAIAAILVFGAAAFGLLRAARRWQTRVGVAWRFGINNISRRVAASISQILAFGIALMAMAVIALVRGDLLSTWQAQLPPQAPNHFAFNIVPADVHALEQFFAAHDVRATALYPIVRGRLVAVNGTAVRQAVTKERNADAEALQRELNLTWTATLPADNAVVEGEWWQSGALDGVSVEQRLAEQLAIKLGDRLDFSIGGEPLHAHVRSIRSVQWDSFHPNFYMIFPPGALGNRPATYLTSFYLPVEKKPLLAALVRAFPAVTVLEVDRVLAQVRTIVQQAALAVEFVLLFVLLAGFAVLYAALAATLDERYYEGALLRVFGASRRQLRAGQFAEFAVLGAFAGVLAAAGAELIAYLLYTRVFELGYAFKWPVWLALPLVGACLIGFAGWIGTRRVAHTSPLVVLREL